MNKVITVNLNGNAYQVEESAYIALSDYLADADSKLAGNPDRAEIMGDLEQAIADKCNKFLSAHKNVVTRAEIDTILKEMGPVDADASDASENTAEESGSSERETNNARSGPRKLYLIREGSMLGGVCKGLAVYLNADVTIVRLVWAIATLATAGFFALVYLAAMMIVPYAETSAERAEAYGVPFNAQELVDSAKRHYSNFKRDSQEWWGKSGRHQWKQWKRQVRHQARFAARQARWAARSAASWPPGTSSSMSAAPQIATAVMIPIFGIITAIVTVIWIIAILSLIATGTVLGWQVPGGIPLWAAILILIFLFGAITGPFRGAVRGWRYYNGYHQPWPSVVGGMVWLGCLIAGGWFAYNYFPEVHGMVDELPIIIRDMFRR